MSEDPHDSVAAWKNLVVERLRPEPGDLIIIRSRDRDKRIKAADYVEEALEENGIEGVSLIVGHPTVTLTHIKEKQMNKLGWYRRSPGEPDEAE